MICSQSLFLIKPRQDKTRVKEVKWKAWPCPEGNFWETALNEQVNEQEKLCFCASAFVIKALWGREIFYISKISVTNRNVELLIE